MTQNHFDVIIVGAGISGIDAAYHVQTYCRGKSYAILEGRDAIGGTWDLFRYPGIRSDSDMYTFGYSFRPWQSSTAIAHGESIRSYIRETAEAYGIDRNIRFRHQVKSAAWSSDDALWTLEVERGPEPRTGAVHLQFPLRLHRILRLCAGLHAGISRRSRHFAAASSIRRNGRMISTTRASAWW